MDKTSAEEKNLIHNLFMENADVWSVQDEIWSMSKEVFERVIAQFQSPEISDEEIGDIAE